MTSNKNEFLKIISQLTKVTVAIPVTFLCFAGFVMFSKQVTWGALWSSVGVFLLSGASSVLNQVIEQKYDAMMERTRRRPLPSKKCSTRYALGVFFVLLIVGLGLLWATTPLATLLGLLAVAWYILVYTLLKRVTPFATIPGALTGALPLLIGWTAANGPITNTAILLISAFVFIWQIPHFWLLMLIYGKDYEKAGFPTLYRVFSEFNLRLWTLGWIVTLAILGMMLPLMHEVTSPVRAWTLVILAIGMIALAAWELLRIRFKAKTVFHLLNLYMLVSVVLFLFR